MIFSIFLHHHYLLGRQKSNQHHNLLWRQKSNEHCDILNFPLSSSSVWTRYILWHFWIIGYFGYVRASSCSRKLKIIDTWKYAEDYKYVERENLQIWLWLHTRRTIRSLRWWYRWFYFRISTLIVSPPPTISHPRDVKSLSKSCQPHDLILKFGRRPDSELICSGLNNIFISNGAPLQTGLN